MFPEFACDRVGLADADRSMVPSSPIVNDPPRNYENCGLVCYFRIQWINLENVLAASPAEDRVRKFSSGSALHMKHCIIVATAFQGLDED